MQHGKNERMAKARGMISLFGDMEEVQNAFEFALNPNAEEIDNNVLLQWEKELIGLYITKHPLAYLSELFKEQVTHTTAEDHRRTGQTQSGAGWHHH